jgi:hypothetical protein
MRDPANGRWEVGVHEKAIAALESLLFAKYQMFRNVYWHHAVRAATVMYKRIVADALEFGLIKTEEVVGQTDEGFLHLLEQRSGERPSPPATAIAESIKALRVRRLPKRAAEVVAADLEQRAPAAWIGSDAPIKRAVEDRIAAELGLAAGAVFLDYPEKPAMFHLNLLVQRRAGDVFRLGPGGREGLIGLPSVAVELYRTARVLRMFTLGERRSVQIHALVRLACLSEAEVEQELRGSAALLR